MSIKREEVKRIIDQMPDQDAIEVLDFIGALNLKRELQIAQVGQFRSEDEADSGLKYFRAKVEEYKHGEIL